MIRTMTLRLQQYFDSNDYDGARSFLQESFQHASLSPIERSYLYYHLGRIDFYEGKINDAEQLMRSALRENPGHLYAKVYLAKMAMEQGKSDVALWLFAKLIKQKKDMGHLADFTTEILAAAPCLDSELESILAKSDNDLREHSSLPKVSVIILCHNGLHYTQRCIHTLSENTQYPNYEIIVVDNVSSDDTPAWLETCTQRVMFFRSAINRGFIGGNNFAAQYATGDLLVFLNNDTEVQQNWMTELVECFQRDAQVGAAGTMLISPNGKLQEAGGIMFSDGTGWNYGCGDNFQRLAYNFVREVDYCSNAALMVRKRLFEELNGFDERYVPGYEDADICFGIRKLGYKVVYCPFARVVYHEGSTTGTDLQSGFKQHQILNVPKFQEKWKNELTHQHKKSSENLYHARNRANGKRMLIIDDWPPLPDRSSGTLRLYLTVKLLCKLGYQVTFGFLVKQNLLETGSKYIKELQALGVEFVWLEYDLWGEYRNTPEVKRVQIGLIKTLELKKRNYDHIYICFWFIASYFIDFIREEVPDTPIIIDTEDLHYLREKRQAQIQNSKELEKTAEITKKNELAVYAKADAVTTVTAEDRAILMQDLQSTPVFLITNIHEPMPTKAGFDQRRDFLFVGNFNHTPNENGVLWFVKEIFPLIHQQLPDAKAYIVGNNPTPKIKALHSDSIIVTGWVPEVKPYLEQCRVSVVPLLYGAGMKGKVGETLANGLPMVSTSIGAEGMNIVHGEHAFIADDPQQFAALAVELYSKKNVWERMSHDGKELMAGQYSEKKVSKRFEYLLSFDRQGFQSYRAFAYPDPPKVSIVIPVFNQWEFTKQCLESIKTHTSISHEIIAVDNASSDETIKALHKYPEVRLIQNERNVGFPGAINQGIAAAIGEHVLLLNNDTIVTDGWLERMVEILESHSGIGIVGPVSNKVSGVQLDKEAGYTTIQEMHLYAAKKSQERKGSVLEFPRIAFLCTLIKRSLLDNIGGLDERFAPGNYEDDDYCLRANLAGYKTLVTQDVFVHHFGSKSFLENGENAYVQRLQTNRNKFKEKWGSDADDVWLHKAQVKKRNLHIHVQQDPFIQAFERASVLLEDREIALALNYLKEAIAIYHQSPRRQYTVEYTQVLTLAGNVALMAGNLELARQYFEEELNLTPSSLQACLGLARVFKMAGIVDASKTMYKAALQLDPQNNAAQAELTELAETAISTEVEAI